MTHTSVIIKKKSSAKAVIALSLYYGTNDLMLLIIHEFKTMPSLKANKEQSRLFCIIFSW